jgi:hypothetical protein
MRAAYGFVPNADCLLEEDALRVHVPLVGYPPAG